MAARLIRDGRPDSSDTSVLSYLDSFYPARRVVVQLYTNHSQALLFPTWTSGNMRYININGADWKSQTLYPYASSILHAMGTVEKRIQEFEPDVAPNGRASFWVDVLGCTILKLLTLHWMASVLMRLFDSRDRSPLLPLLEVFVGSTLLFAFTYLFIYHLGIVRMLDTSYRLVGVSATLTWLSVACALMWRASSRVLWFPALLSFISVVFLVKNKLADGGKSGFMSSKDLILTLISPLDVRFLGVLGILMIATFLFGLLISQEKTPLTYQVWHWNNIDKHIQFYTGKPSQVEEYKLGVRGYLMTSALLNFYWLYILELLAIVSVLSYFYRKIDAGIMPERAKWYFKILLCTTPSRCRNLAFARFSLSIASHFHRKGAYTQALIWAIACQGELDRTPKHNKEVVQWKRRTLLLLSEINAATGRYNAAFRDLDICLKLVSQYSYRSQFEVLTTQMRLYAELRMWSEALASGYAAAALLMRLEARYGSLDLENSPCVTEENVKADPLFLPHSDFFSSSKFSYEIDSLIEWDELIHFPMEKILLSYEISDIELKLAKPNSNTMNSMPLSSELQKTVEPFLARLDTLDGHEWIALSSNWAKDIESIRRTLDQSRIGRGISPILKWRRRYLAVGWSNLQQARRAVEGKDETRQEETATRIRMAMQCFKSSNHLSGLVECLFLRAELQRDETLPLLEIAQDLAHRIGHVRLLHDAHFRLACLAEKNQQLDRALTQYQSGVAALETSRGHISDLEARSTFIDEALPSYESVIHCALQENQIGLALEFTEQIKSRVLNDLLANERLQAPTNVPRELLAQAKDLKFRISALSIQTTFTPENSLRSSELLVKPETIKMLQKQEQKVWEQIQRYSVEFAGLQSPLPLSAQEIQDCLDEDTILLEYMLVRGQLHVFVASSTELICFNLEVTQDELDDLELKIQSSLSQYQRKLREGQLLTKGKMQPFTALWDRLFAPVEAWIRATGARTLWLVPHGKLHKFPLQAMSPDGVEYLADKYRIATFPSVAVAKACQTRRQPQIDGSVKTTLLAVGNPTMDLPYAEKEVDLVSQLFSLDEQLLLTGSGVTRDKFTQVAGQCSLLHLACHGYFDPELPQQSCLVLSDERLTALDIMNNLPLKARLVVMSACETALGKVTAGDEVIGLIRAILYAGAPAVVASLWSVEDFVTSLLMEEFYAQLVSGSKIAEALYNAQCKVRETTAGEVLQRLEEWQKNSLETDLVSDGNKSSDQANSRLNHIVEQRLNILRKLPPDRPLYRHPYNWAAFNLVGENRAIFNSPEISLQTSITVEVAT